MSELPTKVCDYCGREFEWRKKWERNWEAVRFCSTRCRQHGVKARDRELETLIVDLLNERRAGASICPSEVIRQSGDDSWRVEMERVRCAARRLANRGDIVITQKGRVVSPTDFRGPIRLRFP